MYKNASNKNIGIIQKKKSASLTIQKNKKTLQKNRE